MKPVSKETLDLVNALHVKEGLFDRFFIGRFKCRQ